MDIDSYVEQGIVSREELNEIAYIVESKLLHEGYVVALSFTGSRAFGWGGDKYDIDVRGIIATNDWDWWDTLHLGVKYYDINLVSMRHMVEIDIPYKYWTTFENLAIVFYDDGLWSFEEFAEIVTPDWYNPRYAEYEMARFVHLGSRSLRAALHVYRNILTPLYWLEYGEMELNVRVINEVYGSEYLIGMCDEYMNRNLGYKLDYDGIEAEWNVFLDRLRRVWKERVNQITEVEKNRWRKYVDELVLRYRR